MKKLLLLALASGLLPAVAHAQAPVVTAAPAASVTAPAKEEAILPSGVVATPAPVAAAPITANAALIAPAPETPAANPNAIRVRAEPNNATGRLTVKTDNPGPTRVELTDAAGRPVLTYTMMNGQLPAALNVSQLPPGTYIVRCTAYEKTGMRRVIIGQ